MTSCRLVTILKCVTLHKDRDDREKPARDRADEEESRHSRHRREEEENEPEEISLEISSSDSEETHIETLLGHPSWSHFSPKTVQVTARCASNEILLHGGGRCEGTLGTDLMGSEPDGRGAWKVTCAGFFGKVVVVAKATCCPQ